MIGNRIGGLLVPTLAMAVVACGSDEEMDARVAELPQLGPESGTPAATAGGGAGTETGAKTETLPGAGTLGGNDMDTTATGAMVQPMGERMGVTPVPAGVGPDGGTASNAGTLGETMTPVPAGAGVDGGTLGEPPVTASGNGCTPAPVGPVADYGAPGPFDVTMVSDTGPTGQYTMFRPVTLGEDGFLHPPVSWGNGVSTTPSLYVELLNTVASHGFVVIASNSTAVSAQLVRSGLEWLIEQNDVGEFQGTLAVDCAATIGYSMGGGAAVGASSHPSVVSVVSWHGLQAAAEQANGSVLLITSTDDGFVTKSGYVQPTYERSSTQPTIMATLDNPDAPSFSGHLIPLGDAGPERAPGVAWLRYWIYGDEGAAPWFFGADCTLCQSPWTDIQKKNHTWD